MFADVMRFRIANPEPLVVIQVVAEVMLLQVVMSVERECMDG